MQTIVVLESSKDATAYKALDGLPFLVIPVDNPLKARHLLLNLATDLFICDLSLPDLDYKALVAAATVGNPNVKILLTGTSGEHIRAATLLKSEQAHQFLPKPWQPLAAKQIVHSFLREGAAQHFSIRKSGDRNGKLLLKKADAGAGGRLHLRTTSKLSLQPSSVGVSDRGRYRIDSIIGEGGSGRVCKAYDTLLDMPVAIKFLNPDLVCDEKAIEALKTETRVCLQLQHKHIVRIFNLERHGSGYMLIMEYIEGDSLFQLMQGYPNGMPPDFVAQVVAVTTGAFAYAHRHGILHKDITPGNILLTSDGLLKIIDFGIAGKAAIEQDEKFIAGTPVYMSPEHIRGEILDARSDIYALGVLVTQMLTGRTVNAPDATMQDMAYQPHPPIEGLPEPIAQILESATAFSPADRWGSMAEFGEAFAGAYAMSYPPPSQP